MPLMIFFGVHVYDDRFVALGAAARSSHDFPVVKLLVDFLHLLLHLLSLLHDVLHVSAHAAFIACHNG